MLQADKQVLLAGVKRNALELRQRELEFHVERYTNLATQASVVAGFAFESLVELEVPEGTNPVLSSCYFVFGSAAMALALYVLCIASFACVFGHRLALQGPHGSLERAVHILIEHRYHIFATAGVSLGCLVCAAVLMAWIKMGYAAFVVTCIFISFAYFVYTRMALMLDTFAIPDDQLVTGATRVHNPNCGGGMVDLSRLNPASRAGGASSGGSASRLSSGAPASAAGATLGSGSLPQQQPASRAASAAVSASGSCIGVAYARLADEVEAAQSSSVPAAQSQACAQLQPVSAGQTLHHEGFLFKRGEHSFLGSEQSRRRYFVLKGSSLFYFKSWEDYAASSTSLRAAINLDAPIDVTQHEAVIVREEGGAAAGPNRFDLVPVADPLARRWHLQATTQQEASDWLLALEAARRASPAYDTRCAGDANVLLTSSQ